MENQRKPFPPKVYEPFSTWIPPPFPRSLLLYDLSLPIDPYCGFRESGKGIWGTWEILSDVRGGFHIWPRAQRAGNEEAESAEEEVPVPVFEVYASAIASLVSATFLDEGESQQSSPKNLSSARWRPHDGAFASDEIAKDRRLD
jgi:hypothetical protein